AGMARATLAPRGGMVAPVPALRRRPVATMRDMGMDMSAHGAMAGMDHGAMSGMDHRAPPAAGAMKHDMRDFANAPGVRKG
ncbi:copper resistance system multicopper oxidase, partial [Enterococcus faecium]